MLRGKQKGKSTYRFNPDHLSEGGRGGLIIKDYYKAEFMGFQWDHTRHWEDRSQPCVPMEDEKCQLYSEWLLGVMKQDAEDMGFVDKNIIHVRYASVQ